MDLVVFKKDVFFEDDPHSVVFQKGKKYEILSEDKNYLYIQTKPKTNECSQIPKFEEGDLFEYV